MSPAWFIHHSGARQDIYAKARLAADNSGMAQNVYIKKNHKVVQDYSRGTLLKDGQWWVLEETIDPDPVRQAAGFARVERIV